MTCLFCRRKTTGAEGLAHIFPEGVLPGGRTLARGAVCDKCNSYIGANLEPHVVHHPVLAMLLQLVGVPGKRGKPRGKLGVFERGVVEGATVTFASGPPQVTYDALGGRQWTASPAVDPAWDLGRFRRALHAMALHAMALHAVAAVRGVGVALGAEFDVVRGYVRAPVNARVAWPYVQICEQLTEFDGTCEASLVPLAGSHIVRLKLYNLTFLVDLMNSGSLLTLETDAPPSVVELVGPDYVPPRPEPPEDAGNGRVRLYRMSIE